jgi:hypothetical protein
MPSDYSHSIPVQEHLAATWSAWFDNMTISNEASSQAVLRGQLPDQVALHGVLIKIRDLGLPLLAITIIATDKIHHNQS